MPRFRDIAGELRVGRPRQACLTILDNFTDWADAHLQALHIKAVFTDIEKFDLYSNGAPQYLEAPKTYPVILIPPKRFDQMF